MVKINPIIHTFPLYHLQSDWYESFSSSHQTERVWISVKREPTDATRKCWNLIVNSNRTSLVDDPEAREKIDDDFHIVSCSKQCFVIYDLPSLVTHRFLAPTKIYTGIHQSTSRQSICSLDVAPSGIAVSASTGATDGSMQVWDTHNGSVLRQLSGHYLDVNVCRFFPSGEVILSGGLDMQVKIWSAIDGSCPATLRGHHGAVTGLVMVDRGRNIISVGRDGAVKLWNCGAQRVVEDLLNLGPHEPINCCAIISCANNWLDLGQRNEKEDPLKENLVFGTKDKLLLLGTESGTVIVLAIHSKLILFKVKTGSAVNCITAVGNNCAAYGTQGGTVWLCDLRRPQATSITSAPFEDFQLISGWKCATSPVLSILSVPNFTSSNDKSPLIVVGRQDGSVQVFNTDDGDGDGEGKSFTSSNSEITVTHLTGSDCDPIYDLAFDGKFIYTAARDGKVRQYLLS